jgi:hypothetical protein
LQWGPIELSLRQAFGAIQVGIGQIRIVEPCQAQIRAPQIGVAQRWARLNGIAAVFEYETDETGNATAKLWEWK